MYTKSNLAYIIHAQDEVRCSQVEDEKYLTNVRWKIKVVCIMMAVIVILVAVVIVDQMEGLSL